MKFVWREGKGVIPAEEADINEPYKMSRARDPNAGEYLPERVERFQSPAERARFEENRINSGGMEKAQTGKWVYKNGEEQRVK